MLSWDEVSESKQYQSLSDEDKSAAQEQYWVDVVAPNIPEDDLETARSQFYGYAQQGAAMAPEDGLGASLGKVLENTPERFLKMGGGLMAMAGDETATVEGMVKPLADKVLRGEDIGFLDYMKAASNMITQLPSYFMGKSVKKGSVADNVKKYLSEQGREIAASANEEISKNQPNTDDPVTQFAVDVARGAIDMGPALTAGFLTKSPAVALSAITPQVAGHKYIDRLDMGNQPWEAMDAAKFSVLAEVVPETIPVMALMKRGSPFLKRVIDSSIGEGGQEMLTSILEQTYDAQSLEGMSLKEALLNIDWERAGYEGLVGMGVGTTLSVPAHLADMVSRDQKTEVEKDVKDKVKDKVVDDINESHDVIRMLENKPAVTEGTAEEIAEAERVAEEIRIKEELGITPDIERVIADRDTAAPAEESGIIPWEAPEMEGIGKPERGTRGTGEFKNWEGNVQFEDQLSDKDSQSLKEMRTQVRSMASSLAKIQDPKAAAGSQIAKDLNNARAKLDQFQREKFSSPMGLQQDFVYEKGLDYTEPTEVDLDLDLVEEAPRKPVEDKTIPLAAQVEKQEKLTAQRSTIKRLLQDEEIDATTKTMLEKQLETAEKQLEGEKPKIPKNQFDPDRDDFAQFIRLEGGIDTELESDYAGRFTHLNERAKKNIEQPGRDKGGKTLDDLAERAYEEGFIQKADQAELVEALEKVERGEEVYSANRNIEDTDYEMIKDEKERRQRAPGLSVEEQAQTQADLELEQSQPAAVERADETTIQEYEAGKQSAINELVDTEKTIDELAEIEDKGEPLLQAGEVESTEGMTVDEQIAELQDRQDAKGEPEFDLERDGDRRKIEKTVDELTEIERRKGEPEMKMDRRAEDKDAAEMTADEEIAELEAREAAKGEPELDVEAASGTTTVLPGKEKEAEVTPVKEKERKPVPAKEKDMPSPKRDRISGIKVSVTATESATINDINGRELLEDVNNRIKAYEQFLECLSG